MDTRLIEYGTPFYEEMIQLRISALLEPIGVPPSYINKGNEKNDLLIGGYCKEELIGCCVLTNKGDRLVQLRQMAIRHDYQGRGLGSVLINFAELVSRQHHYKTLMMHARDPVIGFYEKCGYQILGEQFFEVGIGHHIMKKIL